MLVKRWKYSLSKMKARGSAGCPVSSCSGGRRPFAASNETYNSITGCILKPHVGILDMYECPDSVVHVIAKEIKCNPPPVGYHQQQ